MTRRRTRAMSAVTLAIALLGGLVAFLAPSAPARAAGGTPTLTVSLSVQNSPQWGDDLAVKVTTNHPEEEGSIALYLLGDHGARTLLTTSAEEGSFAVVTRRDDLAPGDHTLLARVTKGGDLNLTSESLSRIATITKRATTVSFLDTTTQLPGSIRVQVSAGAGFVPGGQVRITDPNLLTVDEVLDLDGQGVAVWQHPTAGSHFTVATYLGSDLYDTSTHGDNLSAGYASSVAGKLSADTIAPGDPVSLEVTVTGGEDGVLPSGDWRVWAVDGDRTLLVAEGAYPGTGTLTVPLTEWAKTHLGVWTLGVEYDGNGTVDGSTDDAVATLTVRSAPTAIDVDLASDVIHNGDTIPVRVTSTAGTVDEGSVEIRIADGVVGSAPVVDGLASVTYANPNWRGSQTLEVR